MTSFPWTLMVNGISSLQPKACTFVFCQFTSSPRDAGSLAIVSNVGTRSSSSTARRETSSAKSRSVKKLWPNATPIEQDSTVLSSNQSMSVVNESGAAHSPGEHQLDFGHPTFAAFVDLRAAFDSLSRPSLWLLLTRLGIPDKIVRLFRVLYDNSVSCVRTGGTHSSQAVG